MELCIAGTGNAHRAAIMVNTIAKPPEESER